MLHQRQSSAANERPIMTPNNKVVICYQVKNLSTLLLAAQREIVIERFFVYGTLGPGRPNEHVLTAIGGSWKTATVTGTLRNEGWGAELGYPGIHLDENGREVEGFLFVSENLSGHWATLDEFEGDAYKRVLAKVKLEDGSMVDAHIYTLRSV